MKTFSLYLVFVSAISFFSVGCVTKDTPPPSKLKPPVITFLKTVGTDQNGFPAENIKVEWKVPYNESLSVVSFKLFRELLPLSDTSKSVKTEVKNIPSSVNTLFDSASAVIPNTAVTRTILYSLVSIDSLERMSDISEVCSLTVIKSANLLYPQYSAPDTIDKFKWEISSIPSQVITNCELWQEDSLLWQSSPDSIFTGGISIPIIKTLPKEFIPLEKGNYTWGVRLLVNNSRDLPQSYTFRSLTIE